MSYRMWKPGKSKDYAFLDSVIGEQYNIGGVDMFLYTYQGATGNAGSTDLTKPDLTTNSTLLSIGDTVFGENVNRKYNTEAIVLPVVYQIQEALPDLKLPGLFFNYNTMDLTVHYNTMIQRVGRKIIPGDVFELPNLRDTDVYGTNICINKWYVVQDAFKSAEGYSQTWNHHIWKIRVKPLTDSPEFSSLIDKIKQQYPSTSTDPNDTNPDNNSTSISTGDVALDIMNTIIKQADNEVPYMHWDNEHIYNDTVGIHYNDSNIPMNFSFPKNPKEGMYFKLQYAPSLYEKTGNDWILIDSKFGSRFPSKPQDGDFYFKSANNNIKEYYILYQYDINDKKWYECTLPYTNDDTIPSNATEFYYSYKEPTVYIYISNSWEEVDTSVLKPFTSNDIAGNRVTHDDVRGAIPPQRGTIPEGTDFPSDPEDGMYFYRTDFTPAQIWKYNAEQSKWVLFPYGGRLPWVGADQAQAQYLNSKDRVSIHDVVKPNIKQ